MHTGLHSHSQGEQTGLQSQSQEPQGGQEGLEHSQPQEPAKPWGGKNSSTGKLMFWNSSQGSSVGLHPQPAQEQSLWGRQ